jgi:8-oxo-dGTP pyrophosphatase MutT (NUDIX family)
MAQKYRIYINENVLLITETAPDNAREYKPVDNQGFDLKAIFYKILDQHEHTEFYVLCDNARAFFKKAKRSITLIEAAGGLVKNNKGLYLFIYRNDKWDLPKGKLEKGESVKEGALREVEEECGITVEKAGKKICKTYHMYTSKGQVVLKKSHWYKMKYKGKDKLKPQTEEGITEVRWFEANDTAMILENTFPSITEVMVTAGLIKDKAGLLSE